MIETLLSRTYRKGDRIMCGVSWSLFALSLAISPLHGTWGIALSLGLGLAAASTAGAMLMPGRRATRLLNAFVFMGFSALLIDQTHGMTEMHFIIFTLLAFLLFYRDWLAPVVGALVIAVHHLAFFLLQERGLPIYVFPDTHGSHGIMMVGIHAAFVVFEAVLLVYMAVLTRTEAEDAEVVAALGSRMGNDGAVDLSLVKSSDKGRSAHLLDDFLPVFSEAVAGTRQIAADVHAASASLTQITAAIMAHSEETSAQAQVMSQAAEVVSHTLDTVASGAEQVGKSTDGIAKNATEAARVATSAVKLAQDTTATISKLGDSSTEIGQVIKVITSIAQQTNLLALNATIEAARAGEAGKGFAVVANEVKELAKETAKATEDISRKIEAIQSDTKASVQAIATMSDVIHQINGISDTIATSVEEQSATAGEMVRNAAEAVRSSLEISRSISGVASEAQGASRGAADARQASEDLARKASQLEHLVGRFKLPNSAGTPTPDSASRSAASGR